jgi:hypothetical protein
VLIEIVKNFQVRNEKKSLMIFFASANLKTWRSLRALPCRQAGLREICRFILSSQLLGLIPLLL